MFMHDNLLISQVYNINQNQTPPLTIPFKVRVEIFTSCSKKIFIQSRLSDNDKEDDMTLTSYLKTNFYLISIYLFPPKNMVSTCM